MIDVEKNSTDSYIQNQEASVRNGFVRKVFTILAIQLAITFGFVVLVCNVPVIRSWMIQYSYTISILSTFFIFGFMFVSMLFESYPQNLLTLGVFTIVETLLLSSCTAFFNARIIYTAIGFTMVIVIALIIYAATTKHDFTGYMPYLCVAGLSLCLFGFALIWLPVGHAVYSVLGALLFSMYLVCDTQLIIGGKERASYGVDEYVYASLMLYLDIINLFMYILSFLSVTTDDEN